MKHILPLLLLCACSAWADLSFVTLGQTNTWQTPARVRLTAGGGLPNIEIIPESTNWTAWNGHGDFSVTCFDKDGSTWVAKWKKQKSKTAALPGGHTNFIPATPDTAMKVMALRRSSVEPPLPPNIGVTSVEPQRIVLDKHGFIVFNSEKPQKPHPHPNIPERTGFDVEKERARIAAMLGEKAKAVSTGILYPYEVKELNHFFDTPDDWTGWLIQTRGPRDDHWSECGKSVEEPTRGSTVAGIEGYQYRLLRTSP